MKGLLALGALALVATPLAPAVLPQEAHAQSNDQGGPPLGSRIQREQPPVRDWARFRTVNDERRTRVIAQLGECVFDRSQENADWYLQATDYGIADYTQVGMPSTEVFERLSVVECMERAATRSQSSMRLQLRPANLRMMLLQHRYFLSYPEGPDWIGEVQELPSRPLPISGQQPAVLSALYFADCVVASGPEIADYFVRAGDDDDLKDAALEALMPLLGPCLPQGSEIELTSYSLRALLTEGLWHAATSNSGNAS